MIETPAPVLLLKTVLRSRWAPIFKSGRFPSRILRCLLGCAAVSCALVNAAFGQTHGATAIVPSRLPAPPVSTNEQVILPPSVPDPFEPFNRGLWVFNKALLRDVVQPTARGYRFIVRKPVRTGIANFGRNISYPVRLFNNLLQRKWAG